MKSFSPFLLFLLLPSVLSGTSLPDSLFIKGNNHYLQREYNMAEQCYERILQLGFASADVYFNLGNSKYKQDKIAEAILYYERALLLKPYDEDIKANLELANSRIVDKIDAIPEFIIVKWMNMLRGLFSPDSWALIGIVLFVAGLSGLLINYFTHSESIRRVAFAGGTVLIILSLISVILMISRINVIMRHERAIIMSPTVTARSSPDEQSTNVFVLHEGTTVAITDSVRNWKEIRIPNGNTGWIPSETLEEI